MRYRGNGISEKVKKIEKIVRYLSMPNRKYDYCIETNCRELVRVLDIIYGGFSQRLTARNSVKMEIQQIKKEEYVVSFDGVTQIQRDPLCFVNNTLFAHPYFDEDILALHGAAVERDRKAFLFLGSTGSGKTTLTAYLTSSGLKYITEDCILIDFKQGVVNPNLNPLHLREGGLEILRQNHVFLKCQYVDYFYFRRYVHMPQNIEKMPIPLGGIFFITRNEHRNTVLPISAEDAFFRLMKAPITPYPLRKPYVQAFKRLSSFSCFNLEYADLSFVKEVMDQGIDCG